MKNTILKILAVILFFQIPGFVSSSDAAMLDMQAMESLLESDQVTDNQYNEITDILESGVTDETKPSVRTLNPEEQALVNNKSVNEASALLSVQGLQKYSEKMTIGYGQWGFHFIFISNDGSRHELTSYKKNESIRPASTLKLFTADLAYDLKTETLINIKEFLHRSLNGMADAALRKTAEASHYVIPQGSYLNDPGLLDYKMWDGLENKDQIIDLSILRGCGMIVDKYSQLLEDGSKLRPVNGSGLQMTLIDTPLQMSVVTARLETALLERIFTDRAKYNVFKKLLSSPGTLRNGKKFGSLSARFTTGRNFGKIYAKTGTLGTGKGLAGYVETQNGTLIFSILSDNLQGIDRAVAFSKLIEPIVTTHLKFLSN